MLFARRVAPAGMASVGWFPLPPDRWSFAQVMHTILTGGALVATAASALLDTPMISALIGAAILIFGLPHGTLDLALIRASQADSKVAMVVALYLGCAGAMYALWRMESGIALLVFLILSIRHFAEDWADQLPPFFAHSIAIALITAPTLVHSVALELLFAFLVGAALAATFVNVAILIAPVATAVACVGIISMWTDGHRKSAAATGLSLVGMIGLPPLIGFTLFFCLMHSPTQFSAGLKALNWKRPHQWGGIVGSLTLAALGIAAAVCVNVPAKTGSQTMVVTIFVTLSILTLPHMIVPFLVRRIRKATAKGPYRGDSLRGS